MKRALRESREIHIRLSKELYDALKTRAAAENVSVSLLIRRILRGALGL